MASAQAAPHRQDAASLSFADPPVAAGGPRRAVVGYRSARVVRSALGCSSAVDCSSAIRFCRAIGWGAAMLSLVVVVTRAGAQPAVFA
ncbi:MAG TPA: hypothetical protein PKJ45_15410, partial [Rubrivivax sp.]|nr:hypothetical protein [Rubrivivax sp.]